jgi:hypothetical protein
LQQISAMAARRSGGVAIIQSTIRNPQSEIFI